MLTTKGTTMTARLALLTLAILAVAACGRKDRDEHHPAATGGDTGSGADVTGGDAGGEGDAGPDAPLREGEARNDATADFRGFLAANDILTQRLMADGSTFYLGTYLDSYYRDQLFGLPQLLGYEVGGGLRAEFRNGKANAINMVLWHLTLSSVARDVAKACAGAEQTPTAPQAQALRLNERFLARLKPACAWPDAAARSTETLTALWQVVMSHDAPPAELEAFLAFFQGSEWDAASGEEAVTAMLTAMLYNPHFLVRK